MPLLTIKYDIILLSKVKMQISSLKSEIDIFQNRGFLIQTTSHGEMVEIKVGRCQRHLPQLTLLPSSLFVACSLFLRCHDSFS